VCLPFDNVLPIELGSQVKPLPELIPQAQAKQYLPAGASIWRANKHQRWCGHMPPRCRLSSPYHDHEGEQTSMIDVLYRLWQQKAELEACPLSEICPWDFGSTAKAAASSDA
jgi:hypothetical protein